MIMISASKPDWKSSFGDVVTSSVRCWCADRVPAENEDILGQAITRLDSKDGKMKKIIGKYHIVLGDKKPRDNHEE
jgi:hypothetical protein